MSTKIVTGKVRFSYVNVWEPTSMQEGQPKKYNMAILIDKNDKATLDKINAAIEEAKKSKASEWCKNGKWIKLAMPLRDGDEEKPENPEYAGKMFVNAKSSRMPGIVDKQNQPVIDHSMIYSGCYGRVQLSFYAFDVTGNKGVAVGLENIQTFNEGESLGGGASAEEVFGMEALEGAGSEDDLGF